MDVRYNKIYNDNFEEFNSTSLANIKPDELYFTSNINPQQNNRGTDQSNYPKPKGPEVLMQ